MQLQPQALSNTYLIQMQKEPASVLYRQITGGAPRPAPALLTQARQATRARVAEIEQDHERVLKALPASVRVVYRTSKVMNGIVVEADAAEVERLRALPGVRAVLPVEPEYPSTSTSVPFVEAQNVWDAAGFGATGEGISIGIIDSGIDYQHPDLGGTGLLADYQANNRTAISETGAAAFPTPRVLGGIDFVGDTYNGTAATAVADPDPMDCGGHGTHVATTAGGGGVNADGTPYAGPWDATTNFGALRIGPGTAPQSDLYAIRVFGCSSSTQFTAAALEWSMDPNGDSDLSDHLDVVNLSLGSSFGTLSNSSTIAADNASDAGMIVVIAAGNSGDTFGIVGAPSVSTRSISVANIADSGVAGVQMQINAPPTLLGNYIANTASINPAVQPPPSGQTNDLVPVAGNAGPPASPIEGCGTLTNGPDLVGKFAFVRRGNCNFNVKVENAQNAGAVGVVLFDNAVGEPSAPGMGGNYSVGFTPTIPIMSINNATGVAIQNAITGGATVNVTMNPVDAGGTISGSSSRGPRFEDLAPKPDVSAPGTAITAAQTGITCFTGSSCQAPDPDGIRENGQTLTISGTSMATPHVAGLAALLRQLHPTRSPEEIKASLMNGAMEDVFLGAGELGGRISTSRAGSGRVNGLNSAALEVLAFNADNSGIVSVGFEPEVIGTSVQTRKLRLVNHGDTALSLDLAFDVVRDAPGVAFSLPGGTTVSLDPHATTVIDVQLSADASLMEHPRDPTMSPSQTSVLPNTAQSRHWLSEESALLVLSSGATPLARVPVYVAPRATSQMQFQSSIDTAGAATGTAPLTFSGTGLCSGTLAPPTCTVAEGDVLSIYSGFELQALSPRNPAIFAHNDIRYVGAATIINPLIDQHVFAISTHGASQTAYAGSFQVEIDTNNDGTAERILFNGDTGTVGARVFGSTTAVGLDVNWTYVITVATSSVSSIGHTELFNPRVLDMRVFGTDVMFLAAPRDVLLGPASTDATSFRYRVSTCFAGFPLCNLVLTAARMDQTGWIPWNPAATGITVTPFLNDDQPTQTASLNWNTANLQTNGSLGALLFHHHNAIGTTQQVITLANTDIDVANDSADVSVGLTVDDPTPALSANVTFTLTAQHAGPNTPADITATFFLPEGLTYVSDTSGGAYNPLTGAWSIPAAVSGVPATIDVVATVEQTQPITIELDAMGNFVDPDLSDNHAEVQISSAHTADLNVGIAASASPITAGASVTYTVTVSNKGPDTAYSVDVVHELVGLSLLPTQVTPSAGTYDANTRTWTLSSLANDQTETLALTYTLTQSGTFSHTVVATHDDNDPSVPNQDEAIVEVLPGAIDELVKLAGDNQSAIVNATFAADLSVRAEDEFNNFVSGATITFTPPASGASGSFAGPAAVVTDAGGIATAPDFTANGIAGSYVVTATGGTESVTFALENLRRVTTTTLGAVPPTANVGQTVTLTATVLDALSAPVTTGAVNFSANGTALCTGVALSVSGTAECQTSFAAAGNVTVRADFVQTAEYAASFDEADVVVSRLASTVTASVAPPTTVLPGSAVTLLVSVTGAATVPTGTVTFRVDGVAICTSAPLTAGAAQCSTTAPAATGTHPVVVEYSGSAIYLPGSGNASLLVGGETIFANGFED